MHRYLRAVGFSGIQKREEYDELVRFTAECYQTEETAVTAEGEDFSERKKAFAEQMGLLVDRMSVNLELPTAEGLSRLAPNKHRKNILTPMRQIQQGITQNKEELMAKRDRWPPTPSRTVASPSREAT